MGILQGLVSNNNQLFALWKGEPDDNRIFFSSWNGKDKWAPAITMGGNTSVGPALAVVTNWENLSLSESVYAAWKGEWSDPRLFFAKLNDVTLFPADFTLWGPQAQIPGAFSDVGPALGTAFLGGILIAAWKNAFDQSLYYASYDGSQWSRSPHAKIPGAASSIGPSLAAFGNKLYAMWKGEDTDQSLYYASYDGSQWSRSPHAKIPGVASSIGASLAAFGNKLYAMWKGEDTDVSLYNAYFNGNKWSEASNNIPGNTGPDPVTSPVPAPTHGLGGNSNYILYDNGNSLINVSAIIQITQDIISSIGFSFQLNAYNPNPQGVSCGAQQYAFEIADDKLSAVIQFWSADVVAMDGLAAPLFEEWIVLQQQLQGNKLAAGYQLTITLENDSKGNVTGFTFKVVDNYGVTQATWKRTLLSFSYPFFTSADLAPINAFQLVLVGPYGGLSTLLTSGQGTFTLFATNNLTASNSVPAGDLVAGTGEDANSLYTPLPISYPNGEFWQLFTTSTIGPQIHKKGKLVLRKPA